MCVVIMLPGDELLLLWLLVNQKLCLNLPVHLLLEMKWRVMIIKELTSQSCDLCWNSRV